MSTLTARTALIVTLLVGASAGGAYLLRRHGVEDAVDRILRQQPEVAVRETAASPRRGLPDSPAIRGSTSAPAVERPLKPANQSIEPLPENADAGTLLRSGADLISENSGEAVGADRKALDAGVARVERALALGGIDRKRAYVLLAQAFNSLWSHADRTEQEALLFMRKEGEAYQQLHRLEPNQPEWLMAFASTLTDPASIIDERRRVVKLFPRHWPARLQLAFELCDAGKKDEGMEQLVETAQLLAPDEIGERGPEVVGTARWCMDQAGAERIGAILNRRRRSDR